MPHVPDTVPGKRVTDAGARTEGRGQPSNIRGGSRMQESCPYGSVRGAPSNGCPYRNRGDSLWFRAPRRPPGLTGRALSTAQWPAIPLRLGSGGFVEGGAGVERCCAAQIAGMSIVVWATAMHRAAVVPNHEIAGPPFMAVDEFGPGCVESEVVQ